MESVEPMEKCPKCGQEYGIGDYPFCPHGSVIPDNNNFTPYKDIALGRQFNTRGERREHMKRRKWDWDCVGVGMPGCET